MLSLLNLFKREVRECRHRWKVKDSSKSAVFYKKIDETVVEECVICRVKRVTWRNTAAGITVIGIEKQK